MGNIQHKKNGTFLYEAAVQDEEVSNGKGF